nr:cyclic lactone autoinducer peptide [Anaerobacterium chartisolvens]
MKKLLYVLAGLLSLFAMISSSAACWWMAYQPKVPKSLK